jgi:thiamine-phosphate pyrophosphorylase
MMDMGEPGDNTSKAMWIDRLRGFYAVLDREDERLAATLCEVAAVLQVRVKGSPAARRAVAALALRTARRRGVPVVINDDLELALSMDAAGVHLGQDDLPLAEARRIVGPRPFLIGISTHTLPQVDAAVAGGASYLGFGPIFPTSTKENPDAVVGLGELRKAVRRARSTPIVAIGGITPQCAPDLADCGAAMACAISSVNDAAEPLFCARQIDLAFLAVAKRMASAR